MSILLLRNPAAAPPPPTETFPAVAAKIAFATQPLAAPTYTDVSAFLREFSSRRGRSYEYDRMEAGTVSYALSNRDQRFNPDNTASPYSPNVKPTRRVLIEATWASVAYPVILGFTEGYPQDFPGAGFDAVVRQEASDWFMPLTRLRFPPATTYPEQKTGARIAAALTTAGIAAADTAIDTGQSTVAASGDLVGEQIIEHILLIAEAENGRFYAARDGKLTFRERHGLLNDEITPRGIFGDGGGFGDVGTVTLSGNEITDVVRSASVTGDGRSPEGSMGIWRAATNLENSAGADVSFETTTTGYTTGGTNTIASDAAQAKFAAKSCKATYQDSATLLDIALTLTAAAHSAQRWIWIPTAYDGGGISVQFANYAGATGTLAVAANMALRDQWQRVRAQNVGIVAGDLVGNVQVVNTGAAPTAGRFIYVDGCQTEGGSGGTGVVATPFTISPRAAARVQAPSSLIDRTQCWVALRVRMGVSNTAPLSNAFPFVWNDNADANNDQLSIFIDGDGKINFRSFDATAQDFITLSPAYAVGDKKTLIYAVTAAQLKASIDGAAFSTVSRLHVPRAGIQAATFNIGTAWNNWQSDFDVLWFACGTGTLTDADAATLHGFGDTMPAGSQLPAASTATMLWDAVTSATVLAEDEIPYLADQLRLEQDESRLFNVVRITIADGTTVEARNQASIDDHFERTLEKTWPLASALEAQDAADYMLSRLKDAAVRVGAISFSPSTDPTVLWPIALGMEIGQKWTFRLRPKGGGDMIARNLIVDGVAHTAAPRRWVETLQMVPADTKTYWRLGVTGQSELNNTTALAY